jgi:putative salt-induced outer membrane protein
MHRSALRTALFAVALIPGAVAAQDPAPAAITKFAADLGYVTTSGNTQVTTMNLGEKLTRERGRLTLQQGFAIVYGKQRDTVNVNSLRTNLRGDYKIDRLLALFVGGSYDRNTFAGVERRFEEQIGVQARVLAAARDTVRVEGGGSFTQQLGTDGRKQDFPAARGAAAWRHAFTAATYFQQNLEFIPNLKENEDWRVNTESSLIAPLSARIGLKLSYVIRFDNLPEPGFATTDKLFTTGIQLTF